MGGNKEMMIEHDHNLALATAYLIRIEFLEVCQAHGMIFGGGSWDLDPDFWKRAMAERNRGNNGTIPWAAEMNAREFTDLIKEAYDTHCSDCCTFCQKIMAE